MNVKENLTKANDARWVILGANGLLGSEFSNLLTRKKENVVKLTRKDCDITKKKDLDNYIKFGDYVLNCAAWTSVEAAEFNVDQVMEINSRAVAKIAQTCLDKKSKLIHFSTDYVFGNSKYGIPIPVNSPTNPRGVYATSKAEAESHVLKILGFDALIIRVAWLYGKYGNNFVFKVLAEIKKRNTLKIVDDQYGQPTWSKDVVEMTIKLLKNGHSGIHHLTNTGFTSRYELAVRIAKHIDAKEFNIERVSSRDYENTVFRPLWSVLEPRPESTMRSWKTALDQFLSEECKNQVPNP